ncbi:MAG: GntR family transcriptional regulator [Planctomycetes bacterium]|nr:GntR family transcriptional regulator [Planctomycetota bacterium]
MLVPLEVGHPTLVDQVVAYVYSRIVAGELSPGQRITEMQLAEDFGASRTPIREAVRRLVEMGVVVARPWARLEVAAPDAREMVQIHQVREELECMALRLAVPSMTEGDFQALRDLVDQCEKLARKCDRVATFRADSRFHLAIAAAGDNRCLVDVLARLDVKVQMCRAFACVSPAKIRRSVAFHRTILDAIERRDVKAAQKLMREHIQGTVDTR